MTATKPLIEQDERSGDSQVEAHSTVKQRSEHVPSRQRYAIPDLMAEMSEGLPRVEGWDDMPNVGLEND